jgi:hypothetical protein
VWVACHAPRVWAAWSARWPPHLTVTPHTGCPQVSLRVGGMSCSACVGSVERALAASPGVTHAAVALLTDSAEVREDL